MGFFGLLDRPCVLLTVCCGVFTRPSNSLASSKSVSVCRCLIYHTVLHPVSKKEPLYNQPATGAGVKERMSCSLNNVSAAFRPSATHPGSTSLYPPASVVRHRKGFTSLAQLVTSP